jgi:DNA-binding NarL/FixJ family response regulator
VIRVLVGDDHAVVRRGLKHIVRGTCDITVIDEAGDGNEVLEKVLRSPIDVVVLDISMPGRSGLDVLGQLKGIRPDLPVLVLSVHSEYHYARRVLKMGAAGYLSKERAPEELIDAIRTVAQGKKYITSSLAMQMAEAITAEEAFPRHDALSSREFEVLRLVGNGRTVSEAAGELCLSVKTVSTYRTRLLEKMGMRTNSELTRYAVENGLVV